MLTIELYCNDDLTTIVQVIGLVYRPFVVLQSQSDSSIDVSVIDHALIKNMQYIDPCSDTYLDWVRKHQNA